MRLSVSLSQAGLAWLRGSLVTAAPEMLIRCRPRCRPRISPALTTPSRPRLAAALCNIGDTTLCAHSRPRTWSSSSCAPTPTRSEEHTSELQSHSDLVCRLLLEKKKKKQRQYNTNKKKKTKKKTKQNNKTKRK